MDETLELSKYFGEPKSDNIALLYNHFRRYALAIDKLEINRDDTVLDIACGQGYGSFILSKKALYVFGVDKNQKYIDIAKENFNACNLIFENDLIKKRELDINKIVCIETIEHMEKDDIDCFIDVLFQNLEMNGKIFFSFPIGKNKESEYNEYHLCEPSIEFMLDILSGKLYKINIEIEAYINSFNIHQKNCFLWGSRC